MNQAGQVSTIRSAIVGMGAYLKAHRAALADIALLVLIIVLLLLVFGVKAILLKTTPSGGDVPAHNYLAAYLQQELLPTGKVFGWAPGWWAGFPMFQFYFFFSYLLMALLGYFIPLEIAFKIVSVLGVLGLPVATYVALRLMWLAAPGAALGAVMSLAFLFVGTHTMWGGNAFSTLAGEISHSLSFPFGVLYFGLLYRCITTRRFSVWLSILFALTIFTHLTTAIGVGVASLFFLLTRSKGDFFDAVRILFYVYGLAFLLTAFWGVPLLAKIGLSTGFGEDWGVEFFGTFPPEAAIYLALALVAVVFGWKRGDRRVFYTLFAVGSFLILYEFGYYLNLVDIRFWPGMYFFFLLLAVFGMSFSLERVWANRLVPFFLLALLFVRSEDVIRQASGWSHWNNQGFEQKAVWPDYKQILSVLDKTPGRAAFDLADYNNAFGSPRAFEAIPYFIDKPIIEGGIVQSGISSLFTMFIQCEISHHCAGFPRLTTPTTYNLKNGMRHLELYNVKHLIAHYDVLRSELSTDENWKPLLKLGSHDVYELLTHEGRYVFVPKFRPIPVETENWKRLSLDWFYPVENLDEPLVFFKKNGFSGVEPFDRVFDEVDVRRQVLARTGDSSYIYNWLILGPFDNPRDNNLDYWDSGSDDPFQGRFDEAAIEPSSGTRTHWKRWQPWHGSREYIDLTQAFDEKTEVVAYAFTHVYSQEARTARLSYGSDDGIRVWLNGEVVVEKHVHRAYTRDEDHAEVELKSGWNRLLVLVENVDGAWGFNIRISDPEGNSIEGVEYRLTRDQDHRPQEIPTIETKKDCVISESIRSTEIAFETSCPGEPHIVKVSYFPNWKAQGADRVYLVSPAFMLVYPTGNHVKLVYASSMSDQIGMGLSLSGILILIGYAYHRAKGRTRT